MNCFPFFRKKAIPTLAESKQTSEEYIYETEQDLERKAARMYSLKAEVGALKKDYQKRRMEANALNKDFQNRRATDKRNDPPFNSSLYDRKVLELASARSCYYSVYDDLHKARELLNTTEESIRAIKTQQEVARVSTVLKFRGISKKQVEGIDKSVDNLSDARDNVLNAKEAMREIETDDAITEERSENRLRELEDVELEEEEDEIDISALPEPPVKKRVVEYA